MNQSSTTSQKRRNVVWKCAKGQPISDRLCWCVPQWQERLRCGVRRNVVFAGDAFRTARELRPLWLPWHLRVWHHPQGENWRSLVKSKAAGGWNLEGEGSFFRSYQEAVSAPSSASCAQCLWPGRRAGGWWQVSRKETTREELGQTLKVCVEWMTDTG